jgi:hypothetical protein
MASDSEAAAGGDTRLLWWLAAPAGEAPAPVVDAATAVLNRVCPIVTGLLAFDERLAVEVACQLTLPAASTTVIEWGAAFARRLASDRDAWISWAAQVDAGTIAVEKSRMRADPSCPGDPVQAILLITAGTDPRCQLGVRASTGGSLRGPPEPEPEASAAASAASAPEH